MTSERPGRVKNTPFDAINYFIKEIYSTFDPVVCIPLLTRIKDSLIGSTVLLNNGLECRVVFYPKDFSSLPILTAEDGTEINLNRHPGIKIIEYNPAND